MDQLSPAEEFADVAFQFSRCLKMDESHQGTVYRPGEYVVLRRLSCGWERMGNKNYPNHYNYMGQSIIIDTMLSLMEIIMLQRHCVEQSSMTHGLDRHS